MFSKTLMTIFFLLVFQLSHAQDLTSYAEKTDELFNKYITKNKPGGAVVIVKDGQVVHKNTFGMADFENQVPITTSTVFDIASVSKQFVGYAIAKLEQEGRLSLDDDVRSYISEFPDFGHTITLGHLLYHQSGLRDWTSAMKLAGVDYNDVLTFDQILAMVYRQEALNFVPGTRYIYSNTGYNVLVEVIQRITQQSFREWTDKQIFQPLGMENTFFKDQFDEAIPNTTKGYYKDSDSNYKETNALKVSTNGLTALGSSSLQTTIDDFGLWLQHLDSKEAKDLMEIMQIPGKLSTGEPATYAYGVEVSTYGGLKRLYHDGSWASYTSYMAYFPDQRFAVGVLLNHDNWAEGFGQGVIDIYLQDAFVDESDERYYFDEEKPEITKNLDLDLSDYTGVFFLEKYLAYLTITEEEEKLYVQATGEDKFLMQAVSESRFWVDAYDASIYFNLNDAGNVESATYHQSLCPRREAVPSSDAQNLASYEGHYYSSELNTSYQVEFKKGGLIISNLRNGQIPLEQVCQDGFINDTGYAPLVEFQRNDEGEIISFTASQYRSRNQVFRRLNLID